MQAAEDVPFGDACSVVAGIPRWKAPRAFTHKYCRRALGAKTALNAAAHNNPKRDLGRPQAGDGPLDTMNYKQTLLYMGKACFGVA